MTAARTMPDGWTRFAIVFWQVILGSALIACGLGAIFVSWWAVGGTVVLPVQLTYIVSGGIGGLALVIVGSVLLLSFQLARQNALLQRAVSLGDRPARKTPTVLDDDPPVAPAEDQVVVPRGARTYHRPTCMYAARKQVTVHEAGARALGAFRPCAVCDPPTESKEARDAARSLA